MFLLLNLLRCARMFCKRRTYLSRLSSACTTASAISQPLSSRDTGQPDMTGVAQQYPEGPTSTAFLVTATVPKKSPRFGLFKISSTEAQASFPDNVLCAFMVISVRRAWGLHQIVNGSWTRDIGKNKEFSFAKWNPLNLS